MPTAPRCVTRLSILLSQSYDGINTLAGSQINALAGAMADSNFSYRLVSQRCGMPCALQTALSAACAFKHRRVR